MKNHKEITKLDLEDYWEDYYNWNWYGYDDYQCIGDYDDCEYGEYKYLNFNKPDLLYRWKRGKSYGMNECFIKSYPIDMDTIYSKEIMRDRKINQVLGIDQDKVPTFADLFVKLKNYSYICLND